MADRLRELVSPLAQREPRYLFGAQLISGLGDWAGRLALAVVVFEQSNSALWTAAVTVVSLVPWIGPGQLLSTFADRFGRVAVMIAADLARAALFVTMALPLPTAALLMLAFLAGLCVPPFTSARGAALIDVVRPERYGKVIALFGVATQAEIVIGYAIGGTVIAIVGASFTLVLNAVTFLVSAALVMALRHSAASDRHEGSSLGIAGVRAGTRVWRRDPICRRALMLFVGVNTMMVLPEALVVPYADELGAAPAAAGLMAATIAVGAMIAMSVSPDHEDPRELLRLAALRALVLSLLTASLFVMSMTWLPSIAALALLVSGAVDAIAVPTNQVVGKRLPREGRAAAMSVAGGVQYGSQATSIAIGGALALVIGSGWVLALAAVGAATVTTWSLARPPAAADDEPELSPWPPPRYHPS
ncbi:MFS transporter [Ilumatobacter sp.]|uniref:MFS transporter n=1 Tax=Ilumatobacter sp. TaxID=1967498 RepID=UPI003AF8F30B